MAGHIDAGDNLDAFSPGIIDNVLHFSFVQPAAGSAVVRNKSSRAILEIAVTQAVSQIISFSADHYSHVVQTEPESLVIRQVKFQLIQAGCSHVVDHGLDLFRREIFSSGIQMDDLVKVMRLLCRSSGCCNRCSLFLCKYSRRYDAHKHAQHKKQAH